MSQNQIQSIKGTHDILPDQSWKWRELETSLHNFMSLYGYREIRTPAFEETELFSRSVGEDTDIVSKEMYSWTDQGGTHLTLKPELTAPVARSFIQHSLAGASPITKLYYLDALFRRDRPQKGRWRQFHQFGVESFGSEFPEQDGEVIVMAYNFFRELGLTDLTLKLNSIGYPECRSAYRKSLREFLRPHLADLSETSQKRFESNPLRILDTKVPHEIELLKNAPVISDYLSAEDVKHFKEVKAVLKECDIPYVTDPRMVRGLDYYTRTTFEITSDSLGAQNAICGGGRYDNLVETLGGKPIPAVGFAAGVERIMLVLESVDSNVKPVNTDIYIVCLGDVSRKVALTLAETLRQKGLATETDMLRRSLKSQLRDANRTGVKIAVIIGEKEMENQNAQVKDFRSGDQSEIGQDSLVDYIVGLNL